MRRLTSLLLLASGVVGQAQTGGSPQFRARTDLVRIEVTVLDASRRPVAGLEARDFTVFVGGEERPVVAFDEVTARRGDVSMPPATARDVASNLIAPDRRLIVLLLDNSIEGIWPLQQSRQIARKVVEAMAPGDLAAVVFTTASAAGQPFTEDRQKLLRAIDRLSPRAARGEPAFLRTLSNVTELLAGTNDRRRFVVAIASGVPLDIGQIASPAAVGSPVGSTVEANDQFWLTQDILATSRQANVNIYTVDPYGLYAGPGGGDARRLHREFLQAVAANTGARSVVNTSDFDRGVAAIMEENATYYLLGFEPASFDRDSRLEVRVDVRDARVRTQSVIGSVAAAATETSSDTAFESLLPNRGLPLSLWAAPIVASQSKAVPVAMTLASDTPQQARELRIAINAYDLDGRRRGSVAREVRVDGPAWETAWRMNLPPGRYQLRAVVSDSRAAVLGSVFADLDVPDPAREALWLSPIAVTADARAPGFAGADVRSAAANPPQPSATARREFLTAERLKVHGQACARDWRHLGPVSLEWTIVTELGDHLRRGHQVLERPAGNRGPVDWHFDVDLDELAPGPHVLTVSVAGTSASESREILFAVKSP